LKMITDHDLEIAFRQGNVAKKLDVLRQGIAHKTGAKTQMKWIFRMMLPHVYTKYSYMKYRKQLKPDVLFAKDSGDVRLK